MATSDEIQVYHHLASSGGSRKCLLCEKPITVEDNRTIVWSVFAGDRRLAKACDALAFHKECFYTFYTASRTFVDALDLDRL